MMLHLKAGTLQAPPAELWSSGSAGSQVYQLDPSHRIARCVTAIECIDGEQVQYVKGYILPKKVNSTT